MTRTEAAARTTAASKRLMEANPIAGLIYVGLEMAGTFVAAVVHSSIGVGLMVSCGWSVWFGPLAAIVSAQTLGRAWNWIRRDARVRGIEAAADHAEVTT